MKLFHGKPIIQYSIETAIKSKLFSEIIISTDNDEIFDFARKMGVVGYFRPKHLSGDNIGTQEVAANAFSYFGGERKYGCVLYATSPLLEVKDLKMGIDTLETCRTKYSFSVDENGNDAGNYYFGEVEAFIKNIPLDGNSACIPLPCERSQDINTPSDWMIAETKYSLLVHKYGKQ